MTSGLSLVTSATDRQASAALFFSSFEASGTHWNSKSIPVCSLSASMIGPSASGVVGVWSIDIQVKESSEPPDAPLLELPQAARALAPATPAAAEIGSAAWRERARVWVGSG